MIKTLKRLFKPKENIVCKDIPRAVSDDSDTINSIVKETISASHFAVKYFDKTGTVSFPNKGLLTILAHGRGNAFNCICIVYTDNKNNSTTFNIEYSSTAIVMSSNHNNYLTASGNPVVDQILLSINRSIAQIRHIAPLENRISYKEDFNED